MAEENKSFDQRFEFSPECKAERERLNSKFEFQSPAEKISNQSLYGAMSKYK